jgi:hypothetical protein
MATVNMTISAEQNIGNWVQRHPIGAYFLVAFVGTWLFFAPILFSQRGLGLISISDEAGLLFFIAAT